MQKEVVGKAGSDQHSAFSIQPLKFGAWTAGPFCPEPTEILGNRATVQAYRLRFAG